MKKLYFILLSSLLCGCDGQSLPDSADNMEDTPLSVSSVSLSGVETRSTTTLTNGSIGVFRTTANGYAALNNVMYAYSSGWSAGTRIYLNSNAASICGYYPYNINSAVPTAIDLTSQVYSADKDICYSTLVSTPSSASPSIAFTMNHAYAKIYFTITRSATYNSVCTINNISIANAGIKTATTLDITSGTYATGTAGTVSYNPGIVSIGSGGSATSQVLMVPTTMSGNLDINFNIDGAVLTASFPVSTSNLSTLAAGSNYKINITVQATSLSVTGVDISAWTNYNATDTGVMN